MVDALFASFVYGLSGSLHCVAMCGPLAMLSSAGAKRRSLAIIDEGPVHALGQAVRRQAAYQVARLGGYVALGGIFGSIGQALDLSLGVTVSKLLPYALVTTLLLSAFNLTGSIARWIPAVRFPGGTPVLVGGFTALIPCGFLYSTAPLAVATGSAGGGALILGAFALGTMPLLLLTGAMGRLAWLRSARIARLRRVGLCTAALLIGVRAAWLQPAVAAEATPACHAVPR